MHRDETPEPRLCSSPIAPQHSFRPRSRDRGRVFSLPRTISALALGAAFLACGSNDLPRGEGGALGMPGPNSTAPMGNGNPGTGPTNVGTGPSSPASNGERPGPITIDTPMAGNNPAGNNPAGNEPPGDGATPVDDPDPVVEEPPVGAVPDASLIGFASVAAAGLDTTTGGDGGEVVTVATFEDLQSQISSPGARVVQVQGTIASPDENFVKLRVGSNKTIIGLGADAALEHIGFDVTGWGDAETGALADFCEPEFQG